MCLAEVDRTLSTPLARSTHELKTMAKICLDVNEDQIKARVSSNQMHHPSS